MARKIEFGGETVIECGRYEVQPGAAGGWTVVGPRGTPVSNWADQVEAVRVAESLDAQSEVDDG